MEYRDIHFKEIWDEDILLSEIECEEWLNELESIINDSKLNTFERVQKIVDSICG